MKRLSIYNYTLTFQFLTLCVVTAWFFVLFAGITVGFRKLQPTALKGPSIPIAEGLYQRDTLYGGGEL